MLDKSKSTIKLALIGDKEQPAILRCVYLVCLNLFTVWNTTSYDAMRLTSLFGVSLLDSGMGFADMC